MENFGKFCSWVLLVCVGMLFTIFVTCPMLVDMYNWFVLPVTGVIISKLQAAGFLILLSIMKYKYDPKAAKHSLTECWQSSVTGMSYWLIAYGTAYVYKIALS